MSEKYSIVCVSLCIIHYVNKHLGEFHFLAVGNKSTCANIFLGDYKGLWVYVQEQTYSSSVLLSTKTHKNHESRTILENFPTAEIALWVKEFSMQAL